MITLDASALVKLVISEEHSEDVERIVRRNLSDHEPVIAPCIALYEAMNAIWVYAVLKRKLEIERADTAIGSLLLIWGQIKHADSTELHRLAMRVALESKLTVYDSLYAAVSMLYRAPLLTFDKEILLKAEKLGIETVA